MSESGSGSEHSSPSESDEDRGGVPATGEEKGSSGEVGTDGSATETPGSGGASITDAGVVGTEGVVQSVTKLLEAQTQMVAKAMVAQSFPPLPAFTGESEEENLSVGWSLLRIEPRWLGGPQNKACINLSATSVNQPYRPSVCFLRKIKPVMPWQ